jgi:putative membrane protein
MKRALFLVLLAGCVRETPDPDMTAAMATTETTATNTSTISATTTGITGGSVTAMTPAEKEFVIQASYTGLAEVAAGRIATSKATNADVRAYAQRMVTEHGRSNEELQKLATAKGLALPTALDDAHQEVIDKLQDSPAPRFDRVYITQMVQDHQKAIAMFNTATGSVQDRDVQVFISRTLPVLQQHLQAAQALQSKIR